MGDNDFSQTQLLMNISANLGEVRSDVKTVVRQCDELFARDKKSAERMSTIEARCTERHERQHDEDVEHRNEREDLIDDRFRRQVGWNQQAVDGRVPAPTEEAPAFAFRLSKAQLSHVAAWVTAAVLAVLKMQGCVIPETGGPHVVATQTK